MIQVVSRHLRIPLSVLGLINLCRLEFSELDDFKINLLTFIFIIKLYNYYFITQTLFNLPYLL